MRTILRRSAHRRWLMPLVILAIAALLMWWSQLQRRERHAEVRRFVETLVSEAAAAPSPAVSTALDPNGLDVPLRNLLTRRDGVMQIDVRAGDVEGFGDGSATHTAVIRRDGRPVLGLRLMHGGERIDVIGYWDPMS